MVLSDYDVSMAEGFEFTPKETEQDKRERKRFNDYQDKEREDIRIRKIKAGIDPDKKNW